MGTWTDILQEVQETPTTAKLGAPSPFDIVRRKYLAELAAVTGHPVIVYATAFLDAQKSASNVSIHTGDKEGFLEVTRDLPDGALDVILHSPGGTAEAAESIVTLLRARFDPVRFVIMVVGIQTCKPGNCVFFVQLPRAQHRRAVRRPGTASFSFGAALRSRNETGVSRDRSTP